MGFHQHLYLMAPQYILGLNFKIFFIINFKELIDIKNHSTLPVIEINSLVLYKKY